MGEGEVQQEIVAEEIEPRRVVRIYSSIDDSIGQKVTAKLLALDVEAIAPIRMFITSEGGDMLTAWAIIDMMKWIRSRVDTYALGDCSSAGAIIFLGGAKRYIFPHTTMLLHSSYEDITKNSTATKMAAYSKQFERDDKVMFEFIAESTGKSLDEIESLVKDKEVFFNATEAIEFGIAHELVPLKRPAALAKSARRTDVQTS